MSEDFEVDGMKIDLPNGRYVWTGERDNSFYIEFCNSEGVKSRIRLSPEAAEALRYLLGKPEATEGSIRTFLVHMTKAVTEAREQMVWKEVKIDTLPNVAP